MDKARDVRRGAARLKHSGHKPSVGGGGADSSSEKSKKDSEMGIVVSDKEDELRSPNTSNRFLLSEKLSDDSNGVSPASVPRRLRSAIKKRGRDSVSPPLSDSKKLNHTISGTHSQKMSATKKPKSNMKQRASDKCPKGTISGSITKEEEEVVQTLYALAGMFYNNNSNAKSKQVAESLEPNPPDFPESEPAVEAEKNGSSALPLTTDEALVPSSGADKVKEMVKVDSAKKVYPSNEPSSRANPIILDDDYVPRRNQPTLSSVVKSDQQLKVIPSSSSSLKLCIPPVKRVDTGSKQPQRKDALLLGKKKEIELEKAAPIKTQLEPRHTAGDSKKAGKKLLPALPSILSLAARPAILSLAARPAILSLAARPSTVSQAARPSTVSQAARPSTTRPPTVSQATRPSTTSSVSQGAQPSTTSTVSQGAGVAVTSSMLTAAEIQAWPDVPSCPPKTSSVQNHPSRKASKVPTIKRKPSKRCATHVYISRLIQALKKSECEDRVTLPKNHKRSHEEGLKHGVSVTNNNSRHGEKKDLNRHVSADTMTIAAVNKNSNGARSLQQRQKQDQPLSALPSDQYAMQKQNFDFLSLSAGGSRLVAINDGSSRARNVYEQLPPLQVPYPYSFMQHEFRPAYSSPQSSYNSSSYPEHTSSAGQVHPYGTVFYDTQASSPPIATKPQQQQLQSAHYRPGDNSKSTSQMPNWQNGAATTQRHQQQQQQKQQKQQQKQLVSIASSPYPPSGKVTKQDHHNPSVYEEHGGGFRTSTLPLHLLCHERL